MGLTPEQHEAVDTYLAKIAPDDASLVKALLTAGEMSSGDPAARSPKDARGLMQLTPIALQDMGIDPKTFDYNSPAESLKAGAGYVKLLRDKYGLTNPLQIAAAYNAGPGPVQEAVKAGTFTTLPEETRNYVRRMSKALGVAPAAAPATASAPAAAAAPVTDPNAPMAGEVPFSPAEIPPGLNVPAAAQPPSMLGVVAGAPVRAMAGLADLGMQAGATVLAGPNNTLAVPSATEAVNAVLPAPGTTGQTYADAAAQGATIGAVGGPVGALTGAAAGVAGQAGSDLFERLGLPPILGGIIGGGSVGVVTTAGRMVGAGVKAVSTERAAARAAVSELKAATTALDDVSAATAKRMAEVEAQGTAAVGSARDLRTSATRNAESRVQRHAELQAQVKAEAEASVDRFLIQEQTPVGRADMLQQVTQGRRDVIHAHISDRYGEFLGRADQLSSPVYLRAPRQGILETAGSIVDDVMSTGLPRDQATQAAQGILRMIESDSLKFSEAQALRSSVGKYYAQAEGPAKARFEVLNESIERAMMKALPEDMRPEFNQLKTYRRAEARLFQESYARKALGNDDAGRAVATTYITRLLNGKWSPAKQQELRDVMVAADEGGHAVLKDALLRQGMAESTVNGEVNWAHFSRTLRNPEGLQPMTNQLLSVDEQRFFQTLSEDASRAARQYEEATTAYRVIRRSASDTLKQTTRDARGTLRAAEREGAADLASARARHTAARNAVPEPSESVLAQVGMFVLQKPTALRVLLDPSKRSILRRASRIAADSVRGQEMIRTLLAGAVAADQPASAPNTTGTPSVLGTP